MEGAQDLPSYQAALADLDRELLNLSGANLISEEQSQRDELQDSARQGHQRVSREQGHAQTVASASRRIDALPSQPPERQANEQTSLREDLQAIPASSFSYPRSQELLKRLAASATSPAPAPPTTPAPQAAQAPPSGGSQEPESKPAPAREPAPVPVPSPPSRSEPSSGSGTGPTQGSWAPSPPRQAPQPPVHPENGTGNAPYRDDPLF